jgi:hypothetical protein
MISPRIELKFGRTLYPALALLSKWEEGVGLRGDGLGRPDRLRKRCHICRSETWQVEEEMSHLQV